MNESMTHLQRKGSASSGDTPSASRAMTTSHTAANEADQSAALPLLAVDRLFVNFGSFVAVKDVSFEVEAGRTLGLVGESGSGKSTVARTVAGLTPARSGEMYFDGKPLRGAAPRPDPAHRTAIQMVFQNPDAALNPRLSIERLIEEPLLIGGMRDRNLRRTRVRELLNSVGLPEQMLGKQPHQLSGGQKQRVCIARALAAGPSLVIADEAVSALDVSVQGQILNLFADLQREQGLAYLFISHNLSVVRHVADRALVMFFGRIVEEADRDALWSAPAHPYTRALISAVPLSDPRQAREQRATARFEKNAEAAPSPHGCAYRSRCASATEICARVDPPLRVLANPRNPASTHKVACHHAFHVD